MAQSIAQAQAAVADLVERFQRNLDAYRRSEYKEAEVRHEYIEPFFEALGWDVHNRAGYAEQYKDVVQEESLRVAAGIEAPDYTFRIGGLRKFFVEAKKPAVKLKADAGPAYQLRRYAWSAKLPLSVLTDFEEFAVYDCTKRPKPADKAGVGRVAFYTFDQYPARLPEIWDTFAKQSVLRGSFDRHAQDARKKRGTSQVDAEFLKEIEGWRDALARNLALRNPRLSVHELNYAVQATIDRIIFLRVAEDRGIEEYGRLMPLLNGTNVYGRLTELYRQADQKYNAGLFDFRADTLTLQLRLDDKVLKDIVAQLYYPQSPYEFSVLGADILGQVYEQFLGKVIRLTPAHRAVVEEKPEVKKAGGVYYTPTYIVDYIVKHTVGEMVKDRTPRQISKLRILDLACGSGSFLLGAYQCLLDYHLNWYTKHDPEKWARRKKPPIYRGPKGEWRLTTAEKKRILLNNIYGVDIDRQAVGVTKLSLLLKVLEGESQETLGQQLRLWQERALPDLANNIKCGNSLIGPDYWEGQQMALLDEDEVRQVNPFDWKAQFPDIMAAGGFDAVIGNPPYIRMEGFKELKGYLRKHYVSHDERSDLYVYFIERAHKLLSDRGRFGMIVSNKFLRANYGRSLREFLTRHAGMERMVSFAGLPVFAGATVRTVVLITKAKRDEKQSLLYSPPPAADKFSALAGGSVSVEQAVTDTTFEVSRAALSRPIWRLIERRADGLLTRLQAENSPLTQYCDGRIWMGIKSGLTKAFVIDDATRIAMTTHTPEAQEILKPFLGGRDVRRYYIDWQNTYLIYTYHGVDIDRYPAVERHLQPFKARLRNRATKQEWYELQQPQHNFASYLDKPKIIFPDIATRPRFALDETGYYGGNTTYFIPLSDLYLLGLLNSRLGYFYFSSTCAGLEGKRETYLRFFGQYLEGMPIRTIDASAAADVARRDRMVALVERMLELHRRQAAARTPADRELNARQIEATDREIDSLVYELYGLTEEEVAIVEGTSSQ